jgi:hypothetical protein
MISVIGNKISNVSVNGASLIEAIRMRYIGDKKNDVECYPY